MRIESLALILVLASGPAYASCENMKTLAREHSRDMASRHSLDHSGFSNRAHRGARAENVGLASSKEQVMRMWRASPAHAANMMLPGCKAVANTGRWWVMEIGD